MKVAQKILAKRNMYDNDPVTIAFLGDSVTQGCFECYYTEDERLETVYDYKSAYSTRVREILNFLYPFAQINIINSGISGGAAPGGFRRLERDVLRYHPDLVVVSFGLNDCCNPNISLEDYKEAIRNIFTELRNRDIEGIFLTQNYMNTKASRRIQGDDLWEVSTLHMGLQNDGTLKRYMQEAASVVKECGGKVCDLYSVWEKLAENGVNTNALLANGINHPVRPFHHYMAMKLVELIFEVS